MPGVGQLSDLLRTLWVELHAASIHPDAAQQRTDVGAVCLKAKAGLLDAWARVKIKGETP
jgi:hypothetical protein